MKEQLISTFKSVFPNGYINVSKGCLGGESLYVTIGLIGKTEDCAYNIRHNDPMMIQFVVTGIVLELGIGGAGIYTKPEVGSYLAMGKVKFPFRKIKGKDETDMLNKWALFLNKAKAEVLNQVNANNLIDQEKIKPEYISLA